MRTTMIIVSSLTAAAVPVSTPASVPTVSAVVESMGHVGVSSSQWSRPARLEIAAGVGLVIGLVNRLSGRLAASGLILSFVGAEFGHARVRDRFQASPPALLFALATPVLRVRR